MSDTFDKIAQWAHDRNLIEGATPQAQMLKLTEEVGELAGGVARKKLDIVKDGIGDCVVVLTILAKQHGLDVRDCIDAAYDEIKDRKGRMVDGIFVKEADEAQA
jgi:NTP pyrophosphatase (non-canonical NTP hydrolase)